VIYGLSAILLAFVFFKLIDIILKDRYKSGLLASAFFVLLFFFPYSYLLNQPSLVIWAMYLYIASTSLFCFFSVLILSTKKDLGNVTRYLNFASMCFLLILMLNFLFSSFINKDSDRVLNQASHSRQTGGMQNPRDPDIYYIIFDAYARDDMLKEVYQYDNNELLSFLKSKGFFIAHKSTANYNYTLLSLASSLNCVYLDDIRRKMGEDSADKRPLLDMIRQSYVSKFLKSRGYEYIAFASGLQDTEIRNADRYIETSNPSETLFEFENVLFNNNLLGALLNRYYKKRELQIHKERILQTFNNLPLVANNGHPVFVLVHFMTPHPPFVFSSDPIYSSYIFADATQLHHMDSKLVTKYREAYREQIEALNGHIKRLVDGLLKSDGEKIIVIQSDHGPRSFTKKEESIGILNAIYLPDGLEVFQDHPNLTPVNTFRIIFKKYFAQNMNPLDNKTYLIEDTRKVYKWVRLDAWAPVSPGSSHDQK